LQITHFFHIFNNSDPLNCKVLENINLFHNEILYQCDRETFLKRFFLHKELF